eukprot:SAG22_NODE_407_length_10957_cov_5.081691_6_plen_119_part_00
MTEIRALPNVTFFLTVANTGATAGKETVMAFWSPPRHADPELRQQLFAFQSVLLEPGQNQTLRFNLPADPADIATVLPNGDRCVGLGRDDLSSLASWDKGQTVISTVPPLPHPWTKSV